MSSNANIPIPNKICLSAELSLSGEVRPVNRIEQRITEAEKMGFEQILISKHNKGVKQSNFNIQIVQIGKIEDAIRSIFG
jgi:DNA repair protein RadA/Sms